MMMPGMDGPQLVRALRLLDTSLPILGMTGLAERADVKRLANTHLPVMLIKPFEAAKLLDALSEAFGRSRPATQAVPGEEPCEGVGA